MDRSLNGLQVASKPLWLNWQVPVAFLIGISPGYLLFPLLSGNFEFLVDNSKISQKERAFAAIACGASFLLMAAGFALYRHFRKKRDEGEGLLGSLGAWNKRTFWLLALPWVPLFFLRKGEVKSPWLLIVATLVIAAIVVTWVYVSGLGRWKRGGRWAFAAMLLGVVSYAFFFSFFSIRQHHALGTHIFDLGIYDNIFFHSSHGSFLTSSLMRSGTHLSAHFDPILVLLSPLYLLYPRAEFILGLQSVWLALGAIPLFVLANKKLGNPWVALAISFVYLLYPALHGANMYDFHSLSLAGPLLIAVVAALELRAIKTYAVFFALVLLTREDMPLVMGGIGLYAILALGQKRLGLVTIGVSILYLAVVKLFIMPDPGLFMKNTSETHGYAYYYKDLIPFSREGVGGMLTSIFTNPLFLLQHVTTEPKLRFFALLFIPLLFLPLLFGRRRLIALAYGFVFLFFSSRSAVHSIHFQYTTVLYPMAFAMIPPILAELPQRKRLSRWELDTSRLVPALAAGMIVATFALSAKFGALFPNDSFRAGFSKFERKTSESKKRTYAWVQEVVSTIPKDASVSASKRMGPHVSNRWKAFGFPREADYVLVHRGDLGQKGRGQLEKLRKEKGYVVEKSHGQIMLLKKGASPQEGQEREEARREDPPEVSKQRELLRAPSAQPLSFPALRQKAEPAEAEGQASDR